MKRAVAIFGPTPGFLRWAIWQPCPLRELDAAKLPTTTFRQLRSIREVSVARFEQRVFENICVHPCVSSREPHSALGFPIEEVVDVFGGLDLMNNTCRDCPANIAPVDQPGLLAGCYGWLPVDNRFDFEKLTRGDFAAGETEPVPDAIGLGLIELVERAVAHLQMEQVIHQHFLATRPIWYGLWSKTMLEPDQLPLIEQLFAHVLSCLPAATSVDGSIPNKGTDLIRFVAAVSNCQKYSLPLHVEFVPAGVSDGQSWTIPAHCGYCGFRTERESQKRCPACGKQGNRRQAARHRVLGLRPYLHLHSIMGPQQTEEFLRRYEARTA